MTELTSSDSWYVKRKIFFKLVVVVVVIDSINTMYKLLPLPGDEINCLYLGNEKKKKTLKKNIEKRKLKK